MARFEINTPVPDFTGHVGGVDFVRGLATVTSDTPEGAAALAYFRAQGYGIRAMDEVEVDEAIARSSLTPEAETARLKREISALEDRASLEDLRKRHAELRSQVFRAEEKSRAAQSPTPDTGGQGNVGTGKGGPAPAPADDAPATVWREHAVRELGISETDARKLSPAQIMERDRQVRDQAKGAAK